MADNDRDSGTQDRMSGAGNEIKGRAEQAWGGVTGDREAQGKGMMDEAKGKVQQGIGDMKDALTDDQDDKM